MRSIVLPGSQHVRLKELEILWFAWNQVIYCHRFGLMVGLSSPKLTQPRHQNQNGSIQILLGKGVRRRI